MAESLDRLDSSSTWKTKSISNKCKSVLEQKKVSQKPVQYSALMTMVKRITVRKSLNSKGSIKILNT